MTAESLAQDQANVLWLTDDSLQKNRSPYSLYTMPWRFMAGDSLQWAAPSFNDQDWPLTRTSYSIGNTPAGWQGIGWFRLHFDVDTSMVGKLLSFRISHMGASEIYLDGKRIGGFGKVGYSSTEQTYFPDYEPIAFSLEQPGKHVLAVRTSEFHSYLIRRIRYRQGFTIWIAPYEQMNRYIKNMVRSDGLSLVPGVGSGILALLHLFLFLFYPAKKSNLYFSVCLSFFSAAALLVFLEGQTTNLSHHQTIFYLIRSVNFAFNISSVAFVYSVCYGRQSWPIAIFYGIGITLFGLIVQLPFWPFNDVLWLGFLGLSTLEVLRVVSIGMIRKQPGVWLIGVGMLATAFVYFMSAWNVLGLLPNNPSGQGLFMSMGFLLMPFTSSLYLAQDFARTSINLEVQLKQVQTLSAQTLIQEAEKLRLVAIQKEELEQTVQERTSQIQQQADKLRKVNETKTRFFTNLAHEFRTPLTLIVGPVEQILARSQEPSTKQQASLLQTNVRRLLRLVNQLLDLSKLEAGKTSLVTSKGDLIGLVKGMLLSFDSLAVQKQITLQLHTDLEQLIMELDRDKLEKVFSNLFSNALKFTPAGGTVSVSISTEQNGSKPWVQVAIQDTGKGIPAEKTPYVFDQFYQVDASHTREHEGFGIGLALTKELVELHGGRISITSTENQGTLVTVRLPVYQQKLDTAQSEITTAFEEQARITPSEDLESLPAEEITKISELSETPDVPALPLTGELLIIEDNSEVRRFICSSLEHQYRIWEAEGGEEGISLARQHIPDLVITDLMMPRMDGYQVCRELKQDQRTSHIPVLMLTAKADLDSRIEGLQTGADSYLAKPFHQRELLAQIANLITTRQQLRDRYRRENVWQTNESELPSQEQIFLDKVKAFIEARLSDEHFGVDQLSEEMAMSRTQLHRKLKALIDYSPGDLIRLIRLQHALTLLTHNVASVSEVAYQVGFANPASFSASFSRHYGFSPHEAKKKADSPAS
ncbi:response regulator [Rhodocytophaga rosea]|uniref:histidine kinase n=1 Tax=Rhodocytophaga rosea TaxID=2704465 RepID=A0A6C0GUG8_9BACT|nr:ATP-binding protein [Rhodocytophaga rosea]QHT71497.1 response regulator [Rhodocytophaga rosea]